MKLKVLSEEVEVEVSEGGMFYLKSDNTFHAPTLKGLKAKLVKARATISRRTPVRTSENRVGTVTGRPTTGSRWRRRQFLIEWSNGTTTEEYGGGLYKPFTPEEQVKYTALKATEVRTREDHNKASAELSKFDCDLSLSNYLEELYPVQ